MIRFECDYAEGAAPQLLERLTRTNLEQTPGYAVDDHCQRARELIRNACDAPQAAVEFLVGGTQANQTVISAALRPYQGCCAPRADTSTSMRPGPSRPPATRCSPSPPRTAGSPRAGGAVLRRPLGRSHPGSTSSSPAWSISPSPPRPGCCTPGRSWRLPGRLQPVWDVPVHRRGPVRLWAGRAGERCEAHRPGPSDGRIFTSAAPRWGPCSAGGGHLQPRSSTGFPILHQAPRRDAGQGSRLLGLQFEALFEDICKINGIANND